MIVARARTTRSCRLCRAGATHHHCSNCQIIIDFSGYCDVCLDTVEGRLKYTDEPELWLQLVQEIFQPSLPR
jgi:hypothetical protein